MRWYSHKRTHDQIVSNMFLEQVNFDSTLEYGNIPTCIEFNDTSTVIHRLQSAVREFIFISSY